MLEGINELPKVEKTPSKIDYEKELNEFLDEDQRDLIGTDKTLKIESEVQSENEKIVSQIESGEKGKVSFNKRKTLFSIDGAPTTAGEIIASRHFGNEVSLPKELDASLLGKQLRKKYFTLTQRDSFTKKLNKELAEKLSVKNQKLDLFKSKAYAEIAKREDVDTKQEGAIAEKIMIGAIEMISIDRPDLGIEVRPSNAYQDVEEKIDFIITTKMKRRSVGVEEKESKEFDEKSFGIQFTINTSKGEFKKEQIEKAKARGLDVDDLLYVEVDKKMIHDALIDWEKKGKPISGPWGSLPKSVKTKALENLFKDILTPEQIIGLIK